MVKQNNRNGEIDRLARTLGARKEADKYYVYALFAKNAPLPFYIGKGCGGRVFDKKAAEYVRKQIKENYKGKEQKRALEQLKSNKIKKLLEGDPGHVIIKWGLSEQEAFFTESALINAFDFSLARSDNEPLTNAVRGHATSREKSSREACSKAYAYDAFLQDVALERVSVDDLKKRGHKVLLVNLSRSYGGILEWLQNGLLKETEEDYAIMEASRGNWRISAKCLNGEKPIEYVIALYFKKSIGVYKVKAIRPACRAVYHLIGEAAAPGKEGVASGVIIAVEHNVAQHPYVVVRPHASIPTLNKDAVHLLHATEWPIAETDDALVPKMRI